MTPGRTAAGAALAAAVLLAGCATPPEPRAPSAGHLSAEREPPPAADIPEPVQQTPFVPEPQPAPDLETYTVVVNEVPVKELLFALARDASLNVDIHPDVQGMVTLNAVDQTLPRILQRISRQVDLRYEFDDDVIVVGPDVPFLRSYRVDYVNMSRDSSSDIASSTEVATTGSGEAGGIIGGTNTSSTNVTNTSNHRFWETLASSLRAMLGDTAAGGGGGGTVASSPDVIINAESGVIVVRATSRQHEMVRSYVDLVLANAQRQVLIEATVVEVSLSDEHQSGVDFTLLAEDSGLNIIQDLNRLDEPSTLLLDFVELDSPIGFFDITIEALKRFGNVQVLSSPKLMALNNQTAILKVVDNEVFFTIEFEEEEDEDANTEEIRIESTVNTVAVGLVMNVTPQINARDTVTLNVRPTITRILRFVPDPGVQLFANRLGAANVVNQVPVVQVRETETVLRINSGQIAILGGLMQDRIRRGTEGIPGLSDIPAFGELFQSRNNEFVKTELVIFLRPVVVRNASIEADLTDFRRYLPENLPRAEPLGAYPAVPDSE